MFCSQRRRWGKSSKMDSTDDKAKFHMFVENMLNQTNGGNTESLTLEEAPFMSVGTRVRGYDSASDAGNMHCVMRTDQLEADFKKCIQQYQSCGRGLGFTRVHAGRPRRPPLPPRPCTARHGPPA